MKRTHTNPDTVPAVRAAHGGGAARLPERAAGRVAVPGGHGRTGGYGDRAARPPTPRRPSPRRQSRPRPPRRAGAAGYGRVRGRARGNDPDHRDRPCGRTWERRYRNESVSYDGLTVELLSFDPEAEGAALRLRVTPPEEWGGELCAWLRRSGLRLSFEVDGRQVNAVREREITVLEDGRAFEVTYARCILDRYDRSARRSPSARMWSASVNIRSDEVVDGYSVQYDLAEGEEFISVYQDDEPLDEGSRISKARVDRVYLTGRRCRPPLEGNPLDRPPVLHEVSFDVLDVERAASRPARIEDGSQVPDIGTVYLREKDFSDCDAGAGGVPHLAGGD